MGIDLVVHTYGYFDSLYYVLQGLAMFRNSGFYTGLVEFAALTTGVYYGLRMIVSNRREFLMKLIGMFALINMLFLPTTSMQLRDHITKKITVIDNIPVAFALPVGILEEYGYLLTRGFEQVMAPIENTLDSSGDHPFSYYNYGMVFGARLKKEMSSLHIKTPEFVSSMQNFMNQCVVIPSMVGHQFTVGQLMTTTNIWKLVKDKAGELTEVDIFLEGNRVRKTCKEAVGDFEQYFWSYEVDRVRSKYFHTDFGRARRIENYDAPDSALAQVFNNNVLGAFKGIGGSAGDIIRQQMMINTMANYKSDGYGISRARMQQESGSLLSSDLATLYLPMMLAVFKCMVYASFMFLVPFLICSGGMSSYKGYLTIVASLQLWPAINSVLNMIIGTYSNLKTGSDLLMTFSTASSVRNHLDSIVTIAGSLQISVPFLAYWMTNLGASGVSHLAGGIISGIQGVSNAIGGEVSTGNRSIDNISEGNKQTNMSNSNKIDGNYQYFDGENTTQLEDGTIQKVMPNGKMVLSSGAGVTASTGSRKFTTEQANQNQITQGINESTSMVDSNRRSFSENKSFTESEMAEYVSNLAQREDSGERFNYESMGEKGKAIQDMVSHAKHVHDKEGISYQQSGNLAVQAGLSMGGSVMKRLVGLELGASISGALSGSSDQGVGRDSTATKDHSTNETRNNIIKGMSDKNWAKANNIDQSLCDRVSSSYAEETRLGKELARSQEKLDSWNKAQSNLNSQGSSSSRDRYDDVLAGVEKEYGVGTLEAQRMIENGDARVEKVWGQIQKESSNDLMSAINQGKARTSGVAAEKQLNDFNSEHEKVIANRPSPSEKVTQHAAQQGFNPEEIKSNVKSQGAELKKDTEDLIATNKVKHTAERMKDDMQYEKLDNKYKEHDAKGFWNSKTGKKIRKGLSKVPFTNISEGVGGLGNFENKDSASDNKPKTVDEGKFEKVKK